MDLLNYFLEHAINFGIASIPLVITYLQLKVYKGEIKATYTLLILCLLLSAYFWMEVKDVVLVIYQGIPYVSAFLWTWGESVLQKRKMENDAEEKLEQSNLDEV